jgi:hypothetical protein
MFHLKSNFRAGSPISQVPVSWFNRVANFLNNLVAGYGIILQKSGDGPSVIRIDPNIISEPVTRLLGTPVDKTDKGEDDYQDAEPWTWTVGGKNGLKLDAYCTVEEDGGYHYLSRCRLTISKDGLITKVEGLAGQKEIRG